MKFKPSQIFLITIGVLVLTLLFSRSLTASQSVSRSPDTAWIETQMAEQDDRATVAIIEAPEDVGTQAAILAAQLLLTPIEYLISLPTIFK